MVGFESNIERSDGSFRRKYSLNLWAFSWSKVSTPSSRQRINSSTHAARNILPSLLDSFCMAICQLAYADYDGLHCKASLASINSSLSG